MSNIRFDMVMIDATVLAGSNLDESVRECKEFCIKYNTQMSLEFNGVCKSISEHTNTETLIENWYK